MIFDPEKINEFPSKPGVYIMKNRNGSVLYIGKAKKIKERVRQYFQKGHDGRYMVPFLISHVAEIETIVVLSEKEALLLENTLIKRFKPKYNVLLKDDKTYIALMINNKHKWPMVKLVRYRGQPKADAMYFGPYTSAGAARETLDLLNKIFPLRQCSDQELIRRTRPCILYGMKRCIAPCVGLCTKEEYDGYVQRTAQFLRGEDKEVIKELYRQMHVYSEALEFEKAKDLLETIKKIEKTIEIQHVDKPLGIDTDALGIYREADEVTLCQLMFRGGKLVGSTPYHFRNVAQDDSELLTSFLIQNYEGEKSKPDEILLPTRCLNSNELEEILSEERSRKINLITPIKGAKMSMVSMALENAVVEFRKERDQNAIRERNLVNMQEVLRLTQYPNRIECFDNSNISGDDPVAAMVVFFNGEKDAGSYRKYKIKTAARSDDYAAMYEVLLRRYRKAKDEGVLPDLLIVDGGKGQLNVALKVLSELNIITVNVIGVAKEKGRHDKGATSEQVFLPNIKDPIMLKSNSPVLFLLQQIRDEAHRFAITFQRKRRSKLVVKSALDDIAGIGPAKKKSLIRHFGSIKRIKEASLEQLSAVQGISDANAKAIHAYFTSIDHN